MEEDGREESWRYQTETQRGTRGTYVNIHKLATILAPNSLLDDRIFGHPLVDGRDTVERKAHAHEVEEAVHEESTILSVSFSLQKKNSCRVYWSCNWHAYP